MSERKVITVMVVVVLVSISPQAYGTTYYVSPDGNDDANGLSWDTAFATIGKGIDEANNLDVVEVGEGTYYEAVDFNGVSCVLRSTDPNDWDVVAATVIDANGSAQALDVDSNSTISGLTITGGEYGVYCDSADPVISECIVKDNSSDGIYCSGGEPVIINNKVCDNTDFGIRSNVSVPTIKNNWVYNNGNTGIKFEGKPGTAATVRNNTVAYNAAKGVWSHGGATDPTVSNCILWGNDNDIAGCTATYTCIQDGDAGTGNISSYPYFEDYDSNDFHLTWNSPCIDRGDPNGGYDGQTDIDGGDRVIEDCVDMGADELNANLLLNPGFEEGTDANGIPLYWLPMYSDGTRAIDSNEKHSGDYSWKLTVDGGVHIGAWSDLMTLEGGEGKRYELSGWLKAESGTEKIYFSWISFDANGEPTGNEAQVAKNQSTPADWTRYSGHWQVNSDIDVRVKIIGPTGWTSGTVWWDDFSISEKREFLPPYGCVNEANVAETVEFGGDEKNIGWVTDINVMSDPCTDPNDNNITYRGLLPYQTLNIEFPAFNVDPNDANGLPLTPMLLEVMFKDTIEVDQSVYRSYDQVSVSSKIDWINLDPDYLIEDTNRYRAIDTLGGYNDVQWKYIQYGFQKSDYQLLRAINGKFTIRISRIRVGGTEFPIDYVSLRKISQAEYEALAEKQREFRSFCEVELPDDGPLIGPELLEDPGFDDPNAWSGAGWTISGGTAANNGTAPATLTEANPFTVKANTTYQVSVDIFAAPFNIIVSLGGDSETLTDDKTFLLETTNTNSLSIFKLPGVPCIIDGISVREYDEVDYNDPNISVFVRDIMRPVYQHTKPTGEPNGITGFSCWGEVEPASFSVYSENGVNDLTITVSDLTHSTDGNSVIYAANDISIYHVIYDETRLGRTPYTPNTSSMSRRSYGLNPDRLEEFTTLSIEPDTSERIWLKIEVPDQNDGLTAGLYEGQVNIERAGEPNVTVDVNLTVYDITLDEPNHINPVYGGGVYASRPVFEDLNEFFKAYRETALDPFTGFGTHRIHAYLNDDNEVDFNTVDFNDALDRMISEGFAKEKVFVSIPHALRDEVYELVYGSSWDWYDPNLWYKLSTPNSPNDPNFPEAYGALIDKHTQLANERGLTFIFSVYDEPGADPKARILCDRLYTIIHDHNGLTTVTYYPTCDSNCPSGDFNVPDPEGNIPPLTELVDYKIWPIGAAMTGYTKHEDPNYHGYFGYYTTGHSFLRNPVYNRFILGSYAFGTDSTAVSAFHMAFFRNDPYNDFDADAAVISPPQDDPDHFFAYPTWSGELLYTIGGLEAIREGIKDAKYIATLQRLIADANDPNDPNVSDASDYLDDLYNRIDPNYGGAYASQETELGYYQAILETVSDTNNPNDFEVFTDIRQDIMDHIVAIDPNL